MSVERRNPSRSARWRQELEQLLVDDLPRALSADRLDADMVGAGFPVLLDPSPDRAFVAPRHHRIEKAIRAAAGEVVIAKALAPPAVDVILELQIPGQSLARGTA